MDFLQLIIVVCGAVFFSYKRLKHLLHYFQQEEYDASRFLKYYHNGSLFDKRFSLALVVMTLALVFTSIVYFKILSGILFSIFAFFELNPEKMAKKALVMTARAKRILFVSCLVSTSIFAIFLINIADDFVNNLIVFILFVQLQPFYLLLGNLVLNPYEKMVQNKFKKEAFVKLSSVNPKIIGITGSYGKTSTKKLIEHIISSLAPSLATPGSINTLMGICRVIREKLSKNHKYFVVEMGAYGIGSIKRLCDFTPPDISVITAIGHAHYERFKTLETVAKAKLEIAEATIKKGGFVVVNKMAIAPEFIQMAKDIGGKNIIVVGDDSDADYLLSEVGQKKDGITLTITHKDKSWQITAPIYGIHQAQNIASTFALCHLLGIDGETIATLFKTAPQTPHRLEVSNLESGITIVDDAYNSNPIGFASALDLLFLLGSDRRKILVTPGMTELGAFHKEAHKNIGEKTASCADIALIVNPERIPSFIEGFENAKGDKAQLFDDFKSAKKWLDDNAKAGDVILYENDLPDIYEKKIWL